MKRQAQVRNGFVVSVWASDTVDFPVPPSRDWTFVDITERPDAQIGMLYDAATDTFSAAPVAPKTRVSKSQVVSVLTPSEWATANHSTDPEVVWGMAQFLSADYVDLSDPRFSQIMGGLVAKGIVTQARADQIYLDLMALANV